MGSSTGSQLLHSFQHRLDASDLVHVCIIKRDSRPISKDNDIIDILLSSKWNRIQDLKKFQPLVGKKFLVLKVKCGFENVGRSYIRSHRGDGW